MDTFYIAEFDKMSKNHFRHEWSGFFLLQHAAFQLQLALLLKT